MIKLTILKETTRENKGIAAKSGKPYHMYFQTAWAHLYDKQGDPNPYPEKLEIVCDIDEHSKMVKTYPPGEYTLHPSSLFMGQYGLEVAPKLVPIKPKV